MRLLYHSQWTLTVQALTTHMYVANACPSLVHGVSSQSCCVLLCIDTQQLPGGSESHCKGEWREDNAHQLDGTSQVQSKAAKATPLNQQDLWRTSRIGFSGAKPAEVATYVVSNSPECQALLIHLVLWGTWTCTASCDVRVPSLDNASGILSCKCTPTQNSLPQDMRQHPQVCKWVLAHGSRYYLHNLAPLAV